MKGLLKMVNRTPYSTKIKKKKSRKYAQVKCCGFIMILFVFFLSYQFYQGHKTLALMHQEIVELEKHIQYVQFEKQNYLTMLDQIDSPEFVERIAREELGMVKADETLIIFTVD